MSVNLILRFRTGHRAIKMTLSQIQIVARSYSRAKPLLHELSEVLLAHWGQQHEAFWDRLNIFYVDDRERTKMLEFLTHSLKDLKVRYMVFFDQYTGEWGDVGSRNFVKDFTNFSDEVIARIKIEEEYLFPLIERASS